MIKQTTKQIKSDLDKDEAKLFKEFKNVSYRDLLFYERGRLDEAKHIQKMLEEAFK